MWRGHGRKACGPEDQWGCGQNCFQQRWWWKLFKVWAEWRLRWILTATANSTRLSRWSASLDKTWHKVFFASRIKKSFWSGSAALVTKCRLQWFVSHFWLPCKLIEPLEDRELAHKLKIAKSSLLRLFLARERLQPSGWLTVAGLVRSHLWLVGLAAGSASLAEHLEAGRQLGASPSWELATNLLLLLLLLLLNLLPLLLPFCQPSTLTPSHNHCSSSLCPPPRSHLDSYFDAKNSFVIISNKSH